MYSFLPSPPPPPLPPPLSSLPRVDPRGFGVVRSEAELNELMCELYEQEEVR